MKSTKDEDEYWARMDSIERAVSEVDDGAAEIVVLLGTKTSLIRNDVLEALELAELRYEKLRKVLMKLDVHLDDRRLLAHKGVGSGESKKTIEFCRRLRDDALTIIRKGVEA